MDVNNNPIDERPPPPPKQGRKKQKQKEQYDYTPPTVNNDYINWTLNNKTG